MLQPGQEYRQSFTYSLEEVRQFTAMTGYQPMAAYDELATDDEHLDRPFLPASLGTSIFSMVFQSSFPGPGSVYLNHSLSFIRPMYAETTYEAIFKVVDIYDDRGVGIIETQIVEKSTGLTAVKGEAMIGNEKVFLPVEQTKVG